MSSPLKGRKLSPETIAKMREGRRRAKLARLRAEKNGEKEAVPLDARIKDAIIYLRHARDAMPATKDANLSQLLAMLALRTLEGK